MYCSKCGSHNDNDALYCKACGKPFKQKNKIIGDRITNNKIKEHNFQSESTSPKKLISWRTLFILIFILVVIPLIFLYFETIATNLK